jgi:hypothetical protein
MADDLFTAVALRLEEQTGLDRLEARGTLRIALKRAGVDAKRCVREEIEAVCRTILPEELQRRGVHDPEAVCDALAKSLPEELGRLDAAPASSRDAIFRRLGSG